MLNRLVKQGPGARVAILPEADGDLLAETLVAFANSDGGTIFLGLDENGRPTGRVARCWL